MAEEAISGSSSYDIPEIGPKDLEEVCHLPSSVQKAAKNVSDSSILC